MHICEMLIRSNAVDVIVIDSVAALVPQKELEGDIGDSTSAPSALDEPVDAEAHRGYRQEQGLGDLHQPDLAKYWGHVR